MRLPTAIQIAAAIAAVAVSSSTSAETARVQRPCTVDDKPVTVEVQEVPDLKQRCYKVAFGKQTGYVCVWAGGTPDHEYGYTRSFDPKFVTKEGWIGGGNLGCTASGCFKALCSWLVRDHRIEQARTKFDPKAAAVELDKFFNPQAPGQAQ